MGKRRMFLIACGLLAIGVSACSKNTAKPAFPVSGKVVLAGKPVANATVIFHPIGETNPDAPKPRATTQADGSFALTTYVGSDGAPVGEYKVTIEQWLASGKPDEPPSNRLAPKFGQPEASGLTASVSAGSNEPKLFELK